MKRIRAAVLAVAIVGGLAATTAPPHAESYCKHAKATYICEYGVTPYKYPNGTKQEFLVGADHAVWSRYNNTKGKWTGWYSTGGSAVSRVEIGYRWSYGDRWAFDIVARHPDGAYRVNARDHDGKWTGWMSVPDPT